MIERLCGRCVLKQPGFMILDVGGVGYGIEMSESALASVEEGQTPVTVWVHTHVREDALKLFGFPTHAERLLFDLLLSVNDVGTKVAMAIMGTLSLRQLLTAVESEDTATLEEVPGIGPKKSKLILLMLKNKLPKLAGLGLAAAPADPSSRSGAAAAASTAGAAGPALSPGVLVDLRSALENFGYKDKEFAPVVRRFERQPPARDLAGLIRCALAELAGAPGQRAAASDEELF